MRHRKSGRKLNRNSSHRHAMFRNMVTSLFKYDRIQTTDAKAKELRSLADQLVTLAKRGDLHARRQALSIIREKDVVYKLFENAKERFGSISGGYTRIVKIGRRPGDAAPVSIIELVTPAGSKPAKGRKKKSKPKKETTQPLAAQPEAKVDADRSESVPATAASGEETGTDDAAAVDEPGAETADASAKPTEDKDPAAEADADVVRKDEKAPTETPEPEK